MKLDAMRPGAANDDVRLILDDPEAVEDLDDDTPTMPPRATTPEERAADLARANAKRAAERARVAVESARIAKRQAVGEGWDGAANDNESFPLLKALRSEGRADDVALVLRYRALAAVVAAQPLQGAVATSGDGFVVARNSSLTGVDAVDAAAAKRWPGDHVKGGEIANKETKRVRKGAAGSAGRQVRAATDEDPAPTAAPLSRRFSPDLLLAQIDAKPVLGDLRAALGPLLDYFEDAVLGGLTLAAIGAKAGAGTQKAGAVGRAFVEQAIGVLRDTWRLIDIRAAKRAADADRAVLRKRAEIAERKRTFLGRAA